MGVGWAGIRRFILLFLLACRLTLGAGYTLFEKPGQQVTNYNAIVAGLKEGDTIAFSNGRVFTVQKVLGQGNTTLILDIGDGQVLRIPLKSGRVRFLPIMKFVPDSLLSEYSRVLTEYMEIAPVLESRGVPIPKIDQAGSVRGEYLIVEKLNIQFTLTEFIRSLAC